MLLPFWNWTKTCIEILLFLKRHHKRPAAFLPRSLKLIIFFKFIARYTHNSYPTRNECQLLIVVIFSHFYNRIIFLSNCFGQLWRVENEVIELVDFDLDGRTCRGLSEWNTVRFKFKFLFLSTFFFVNTVTCDLYFVCVFTNFCRKRNFAPNVTLWTAVLLATHRSVGSYSASRTKSVKVVTEVMIGSIDWFNWHPTGSRIGNVLPSFMTGRSH